MEGHIVSALAVLIISISLLYLNQSRKRLPLPPGPRGWPFFGTFLPPYSWIKMEEWTRQYGPIYSITMGGKVLVVLGTVKSATDILEKQSMITSDRPYSAVVNTMNGGLMILTSPFNEKFKNLRKLVQHELSSRKAESFQPIHLAASQTLVLDILESPEKFQDHAVKYAASVILSITYGKRTPTASSDPDVQEGLKIMIEFLSLSGPGRNLVDYVPFLAHFPGKWKTRAEKHYQDETKLFRRLVDDVQKRLKDGEQVGGEGSCIAREGLENMQEHGLSYDDLAFLCGLMFGAGAWTTASAIGIAIMASACFPEAQKALQAELDRVVGRERAPSWDDRKDLAYVDAFVKEVFRWRPVTAGGFAHATTEDIVYEGYLIPKGSSIIGNHWSIHRDPKVYPSPDVFNPERFLEPKSPNEPWKLNWLHHYTFGFGRRNCAGKEVAIRSLWIAVTNILWAFDIRKKVRDGKEVEIDTMAFTPTVHILPLPFEVEFVPRVPKETILSEMKLEASAQA